MASDDSKPSSASPRYSFNAIPVTTQKAQQADTILQSSLPQTSHFDDEEVIRIIDSPQKVPTPIRKEQKEKFHIMSRQDKTNEITLPTDQQTKDSDSSVNGYNSSNSQAAIVISPSTFASNRPSSASFSSSSAFTFQESNKNLDFSPNSGLHTHSSSILSPSLSFSPSPPPPVLNLVRLPLPIPLSQPNELPDSLFMKTPKNCNKDNSASVLMVPDLTSEGGNKSVIKNLSLPQGIEIDDQNEYPISERAEIHIDSQPEQITASRNFPLIKGSGPSFAFSRRRGTKKNDRNNFIGSSDDDDLSRTPFHSGMCSQSTNGIRTPRLLRVNSDMPLTEKSPISPTRDIRATSQNLPRFQTRSTATTFDVRNYGNRARTRRLASLFEEFSSAPSLCEGKNSDQQTNSTITPTRTRQNSLGCFPRLAYGNTISGNNSSDHEIGRDGENTNSHRRESRRNRVLIMARSLREGTCHYWRVGSLPTRTDSDTGSPVCVVHEQYTTLSNTDSHFRPNSPGLPSQIQNSESRGQQVAGVSHVDLEQERYIDRDEARNRRNSGDRVETEGRPFLWRRWQWGRRGRLQPLAKWSFWKRHVRDQKDQGNDS